MTSSNKEFLRLYFELLVESHASFIPSSKSKKEEFLGLARNKVSYYQPKIEEICNVDLGEVHVKDFRYWFSDRMNIIKEEQIKSRKSEDQPLSRLEKSIISSKTFGLRSVLNPVVWMIATCSGMDMKYDNSSIYVPFYYFNRFMDRDFKIRKRQLDQSIVHELSHRLWLVLGGDNASEPLQEWRLWNEGFATYCADKYFADLYPSNFLVQDTSGSQVYITGKKLVEKYADDKILDIPRIWRSLPDKI